MSLDRLPEILKAHKQFEDKNTCAASAHESIGKLHGKLKDDDFPLQSDAASEGGGFTFENFLNGIGFSGKDSWLPSAEALEKFRAETAEGQYPLVSSYAGSDAKKHYAHILVAVSRGDQIALIDPAQHGFSTNDSDETLKLLEMSAGAPGRGGKIHFLTYSDV